MTRICLFSLIPLDEKRKREDKKKGGRSIKKKKIRKKERKTHVARTLRAPIHANFLIPFMSTICCILNRIYPLSSFTKIGKPKKFKFFFPHLKNEGFFFLFLPTCWRKGTPGPSLIIFFVRHISTRFFEVYTFFTVATDD